MQDRPNTPMLDRVRIPADLKNLSTDQLKQLADEVRAETISAVSVKAVDATVKFHEGDDIRSNVWTRAYSEELGINLDYLWVVDGGQYQQKLSTTIMSGEIPDIFVCNGQLLKLLYDSGSLADLTQAYAQHASANTREILSQDPLALKSATIGLPGTA